MAHTNALVNIETIVSDFLHGYKKTTEDYFTYLLHACNCVRDFRLYHSNEVVSAKVSVTANKLMEFPSDMQTFVDLCVPIAGEWWSMTEKRTIVNTTTFTGLVEGRDSTFGEGVDITPRRTTGYSASGGINDYNYTIDYKARRIFFSGIVSETVLLMYTSSGLEVGGTTTVPDFITPVIHAYLLWKETIFLGDSRNEDKREKSYDKEVLKARNLINSMSYNQWRDLFLGSFSQSVKR